MKKGFLLTQELDELGEKGPYYRELPDGDWEEVCPYEDYLGITTEPLIVQATGDGGSRTVEIYDVWSVGTVYKNKKTGEEIKVEKDRERKFRERV